MVYKFFDKKSTCTGVENEIKQNEQLVENCKNQLLENLKKEKYIHHLKIIFGKLIF